MRTIQNASLSIHNVQAVFHEKPILLKATGGWLINMAVLTNDKEIVEISLFLTNEGALQQVHSTSDAVFDLLHPLPTPKTQLG